PGCGRIIAPKNEKLPEESRARRGLAARRGRCFSPAALARWARERANSKGGGPSVRDPEGGTMKNLLLEPIEDQVEETRRGVWRRYLYPTGQLFEEFTSHRRVFGLPLLHFTRGKSPETGKRITARGFIAIGRFAVGVIAIGHVAAGLLAVGQL